MAKPEKSQAREMLERADLARYKHEMAAARRIDWADKEAQENAEALRLKDEHAKRIANSRSVKQGDFYSILIAMYENTPAFAKALHAGSPAARVEKKIKSALFGQEFYAGLGEMKDDLSLGMKNLLVGKGKDLPEITFDIQIGKDGSVTTAARVGSLPMEEYFCDDPYLRPANTAEAKAGVGKKKETLAKEFNEHFKTEFKGWLEEQGYEMKQVLSDPANPQSTKVEIIVRKDSDTAITQDELKNLNQGGRSLADYLSEGMALSVDTELDPSPSGLTP